MAEFYGHGGVCVASCFNRKCTEMRAAADLRGHSSCVTFTPGDDAKFALNYGVFIGTFAKNAGRVFVIVGDSGEEGRWQRKEMELLRDHSIAFEKLTLAQYCARYPMGATPSAPVAPEKGRLPPVLHLGMLLCLAALPFCLRALEGCAEAACSTLVAPPASPLCEPGESAMPAPVSLEEAKWQPQDLGLFRELLSLWLQSCERTAAQEGCMESQVLRAATENGSNRTLKDGTEERGFFEGEALRVGRRRLPDGGVQEGIFGAQAGALQRGTWTQSSGVVSVGTFVLGYQGRLRLLQGSRTTARGLCQEGDFFTDKKTSFPRRGKATFSDGQVWEGDFDYDTALLARGTMSFASGLVLQGEFDLADGALKKGSRRHPDGRVERLA